MTAATPRSAARSTPRPIRLLVTAAGTDIGKTFVTCGLLRALCALGHAPRILKPVMSGLDPDRLDLSDAGLLLRACGRNPTDDAIAAISPWRFSAPLSPDMAAEREGRAIDFDQLLAFCADAVRPAPHPAPGAADILLIEGVGGVMAPVGARHTMLDLATRLGIPALLVGGTHLGAISHLLTAHLALVARDVPIAGIVLSESETSPVPPERTRATLEGFLPGQAIAIIPRHAHKAAAPGVAPDVAPGIAPDVAPVFASLAAALCQG